MTAKESIIEKVQKLLELQKGAEAIGSLEEAANAAEKVQRLLLKHNLEMSEIAAHDPEKEQKMGRARYEEIYAKKNEGQWIYRLYSVLAGHNLCYIVYTRFRDDHGKPNKFVNLIGTKENVQVVRFLADQLELRLRKLEQKAWNTRELWMHEKRNAFRRGYLMGACMGIDTQLSEAKQKAMQENVKVNALVLANDAKLREAVAHFFPRLSSARRTKGYSANGAMNKGYQDGKSMQINKGMGKGGNGTAGYLK
jgi:hypothetical protein